MGWERSPHIRLGGEGIRPSRANMVTFVLVSEGTLILHV